MLLLCRIPVSMVAIFCFTEFPALAIESGLRVGIARRDITPSQPVPIWGYGDRHAVLSEGTLDPLTATALVIQIGRRKLAVVGLDLGRSPDEASLQSIRTRIADELGIQLSMIAGSHTHHGPVVELTDRKGFGAGRFDAAVAYRKQLEDAIVDAIRQADGQLAPAKLADASVEIEGLNRNRHSKKPNPPVDRTLNLLRFDHAQTQQPIAVLVNFTGHPTSLPSKTLKFSSDYVGPMRTLIEKEHGGLAVFMPAAAGDISIDRGPNRDHQAYGELLAQKVLSILSTMQPEEVTNPSLQSREERFTFASRTDFRNPLVQTAYSVAFFPELIANFVDEYDQGIRPRLTVVLLNKRIGLVAVSGEFFTEHAIRLRQRADLDRIFFFGYCNGYHQYFPTIQAAAEGGYGADAQVAPAEVGAGEQIMDHALLWLYQMRGKLTW
jgi:hypothetical protein